LGEEVKEVEIKLPEIKVAVREEIPSNYVWPVEVSDEIDRVFKAIREGKVSVNNWEERLQKDGGSMRSW
jgi:hypothetical protein